MKRKYAVVDLEATGPKFATGHRIIQVGLTIIENQQIIQSFNWEINPEREIPPVITELTGITQEMVAEAPLFSDIADYLYMLLEDAVFVAHQASFDYQMLADEFAHVGIADFSPKVLDTVTLLRILYPTEESFALGEVSARRGINHTHHHQAGSDALATAELLLILMDKACQLPYELLEQMVHLLHQINAEMSFFFEAALLAARPIAYYPQLQVVGSVVFRKQDAPDILNDSVVAVPTYNPLSAVAQYIAQPIVDQQALLIEMDTDTDARSDLLWTLIDQSDGRPILLTTSTVHQQHAWKTLALSCGVPETAVVRLRGRHHFVRLGNVAHLLAFAKQELSITEVPLFLSVLVWLTETAEGHCHELSALHLPAVFIEKITQGIFPNSVVISELAPFDFYERLMQKMAHARVIITNHMYLTTHRDHVLTDTMHQGFIFVIDDVARFNDLAHAASEEYLPISHLLFRLRRLQSFMFGNHRYHNQPIEAIIQRAIHVAQAFENHVLHQYQDALSFSQTMTEGESRQVYLGKRADFSSFELIKLQHEVEHIFGLCQWLQHQNFAREATWYHALRKDRYFYKRLYETIRRLVIEKDPFAYFYAKVHCDDAQGVTYTLVQTLYSAQDWLQRMIATYGTHHVYLHLGKVTSAMQDALEEKLGIDHVMTTSLVQSTSALAVPIVRLTDFIAVTTHKDMQIAQAAAKWLLKAVDQQSHIVVICQSQAMATALTARLMRLNHDETVSVLQLSPNTVARVVRQHRHADKAIVVGTTTLFERQAVPFELTSLVIMIKLPFDPPERMLQQAQSHFKKLRHPFNEETLPRMIQRLQYIICQMLPYAHQIVLIDERFDTASYRLELTRQMLPEFYPKAVTTDSLLND